MKQQAFTLIELLVVVLIIGILSAIALPQYQKAVARARVAEALINVQNLYNAEQLYFLANNRYTTDLTELDVTLPVTSYYSYRVQDTSDGGGSWRVYANSYKNNLPSFEYNLQTNSRWCHASTTNTIAHGVCATYGEASHTGSGINYYKMN